MSSKQQVPPPLLRCLAELPPRARAAVDTSVFAPLDSFDGDMVDHLAEIIGAHVVAYDLRRPGRGLALCSAIGHADLSPDRVAALRAAEGRLPAWIALVAYARPLEMRIRKDALIASANSCAPLGRGARTRAHNHAALSQPACATDARWLALPEP